jgi:Domain of unknown function (DUF222)/HNH endonuclease
VPGRSSPNGANRIRTSAETTQTGDTPAEAGRVDAGGKAPAETAREDGGGGAVSNADSLVLMARTLLASGPADRGGGDHYQVVVHVDATALTHDRDGDGVCQLDGGPALDPETARRLACDASLVRILERDGRPLSIGRKTRTIPPALRRALKARDRVCRFPGCERRRFLQAHHLKHWARGGPTDLDNLIQLCSHHHRLVHEGGYVIHPAADGALRFKRPRGQPLPQAPGHHTGHPRQLERQNQHHGLHPSPETAPPIIYGDRFDLHAVVDDLAETDPRLAPTPAPP